MIVWPLVMCMWLGYSAADSVITDRYGAITRGDITRKSLALVFSADGFGEGGEVVRATLRHHNVSGAFFLTGNFYRNPAFASLVTGLKHDGHYLGAHSDQHLLYVDWARRDSLLVTENQFMSDLQANYACMRKLGIRKRDARYFLPPYEWYNATISHWTRKMGLRLINFTPGTRSHADYTYPEMGDRYVSSDEIYRSILTYEEESEHGLNGFILLVHLGTDPRRTDKFYNRLDELLAELISRGYRFVPLEKLISE